MTEWKVLLVDDEIEFRTTLSERLRLRGFRVQEAGNGEEAFLGIEADKPDVVLLDVVLPGPSGFQILKRLREQYPSIPIIILTGLGITKEGLELRAFDYLVKPVDIEVLVQKIRDAIGNGR